MFVFIALCFYILDDQASPVSAQQKLLGETLFSFVGGKYDEKNALNRDLECHFSNVAVICHAVYGFLEFHVNPDEE